MAGTDATVCCDPGTGGAAELGCGLAGDGTAGDPLRVAVAAGDEGWPWTCPQPDASTLRCNPDTGQVWTPPEHHSRFQHVGTTEHFPSGDGPYTDSFRQFPTAFYEMTFGTDFGGGCRNTSITALAHGTAMILYPAGTEFYIGYVSEVDGVVTGYTRIGGAQNTAAPGGHMYWGAVPLDAGIRPAGAGALLRVWPAIEIIAGEIFLASWSTGALTARGTRAEVA